MCYFFAAVPWSSLIPVPSVGPTANVGSATNHLCKSYLLQIMISSTEKGMLKIHESILHAFRMLHSSIFFLSISEQHLVGKERLSLTWVI